MPTDKAYIIARLEKIGNYLELLGENPFKTRAYFRGAEALEAEHGAVVERSQRDRGDDHPGERRNQSEPETEADARAEDDGTPCASQGLDARFGFGVVSRGGVVDRRLEGRVLGVGAEEPEVLRPDVLQDGREVLLRDAGFVRAPHGNGMRMIIRVHKLFVCLGARKDDLLHYRQEISAPAAREGAGARGLSSYPHPYLMPDFWQFPTGSMGIGPISAIYQARFMRYLEHRGLVAAAVGVLRGRKLAHGAVLHARHKLPHGWRALGDPEA